MYFEAKKIENIHYLFKFLNDEPTESHSHSHYPGGKFSHFHVVLKRVEGGKRIIHGHLDSESLRHTEYKISPFGNSVMLEVLGDQENAAEVYAIINDDLPKLVKSARARETARKNPKKKGGGSPKFPGHYLRRIPAGHKIGSVSLSRFDQVIKMKRMQPSFKEICIEGSIRLIWCKGLPKKK
jgi:hypothetical protein